MRGITLRGNSDATGHQSTHTQHLNRIRLDPPQHDVLLVSVPILKEGLIQLSRTRRHAGAQPELDHLIRLAWRAIDAMMRTRWKLELGVKWRELTGDPVDLDRQTTCDDLEELPLPRMEMRRWLLSARLQLF